MTNTEVLKNLIKDKGFKITYVAKHLGLSYQGFKNKLENKSDFTSTEIIKLCEILSLNDSSYRDSIFFAL